MSDNKNLNCDFCGKERNEVNKLIVGGATSICNECVDLCYTILDDKNSGKKAKSKVKSLNPIDLKEQLDEYVISQETAKITLAVAVANHFKRINHPPEDLELEKSNIMIAGPTGCGKTMLARSIAKFLDVPFVITDATTLTESGYVGDDVESVVARLLHQADYDVEKCEQGIIFIDEVDKVARKSESSSITRDVSGEGVQQALLKLVEGTVCNVAPQGGRKHPNQDTIQVDTKNILFIVSGAFVGLDKIVEKRAMPSSIGFNAPVSSLETGDTTKYLKDVKPHDFVTFGLIPEFTGRFPVFTYVDKLSTEDLVHILTDTNSSIVQQYQYLFSLENVQLEFTDCGLRAIAELANELETGARGLKSIIEETLLPHQYNLHSYANKGVQKIIVDKNTIENNTEVKFIYEEVINEKSK